MAAGGAAVYIEQLTCTLVGDVDPEAMSVAWQRAVDRHPALRTWFAWEDLDRPLQIVAPAAELPVGIATSGSDYDWGVFQPLPGKGNAVIQKPPFYMGTRWCKGFFE